VPSDEIVYPRHEVLAAFLEFRRRGAVNHDWEAWASLFTDDATYIEHALGRFRGRQEILDWIVPTMAHFPSMSFWIDWWMIDGNRVFFYIWNHLPDPVGRGAWYSFPNGSIIEYAGGGKWSYEEDFYNPADSHRVVRQWIEAGGRRDTAADESLQSLPDWAPEPAPVGSPRREIEAHFWSWLHRGERAAASGDWGAWAGQFTADARYYSHHYGKYSGREAIRGWAKEALVAFPAIEFPVERLAIEGNRVAAVVENRLAHPAGGDPPSVRTLVILHYAGSGQWSYEEDVFNPSETSAMIRAWVEAGGQLPEGVSFKP
jgi:predicted SnoaL-like aldol condensation-catalyzing enzyme